MTIQSTSPIVAVGTDLISQPATDMPADISADIFTDIPADVPADIPVKVTVEHIHVMDAQGLHPNTMSNMDMMTLLNSYNAMIDWIGSINTIIAVGVSTFIAMAAIFSAIGFYRFNKAMTSLPATVDHATQKAVDAKILNRRLPLKPNSDKIADYLNPTGDVKGEKQ